MRNDTQYQCKNKDDVYAVPIEPLFINDNIEEPRMGLLIDF